MGKGQNVFIDNPNKNDFGLGLLLKDGLELGYVKTLVSKGT
jgi:hypothetical protein